MKNYEEQKRIDYRMKIKRELNSAVRLQRIKKMADRIEEWFKCPKN